MAQKKIYIHTTISLTTPHFTEAKKTLLQLFYAPVRWFASVLLFGPEADTLPDKHTQHKG